MCILPGTDLQSGRLRLDVNGRSSTFKASDQGKLVGLLLQNVERRISYAVNENIPKQVLKHVRRKIRTEWLGLGSGKDGQELQVLETVRDGLVLHAFVEGLE